MFKALAGLVLCLAGAATAAAAVAAEVPRGHVAATVGALYDSNILIATDTMFDQGVPSKLADYRLLTAGEVGYDVVRRGRHHFGAHAAASLINSARAARAAGDPFLFSFGAPYVFDFASVRSYRAVVRPGYQRLLMDPALTSRKSNVLNSQTLDVDQTWRHSAYFDTSLNLQYRRDEFLLRSNVGPDDADANKVSVRMFETYRPRASVAHYLVGGARYVANRARGANARYDRAEVFVKYARPVFGRTTADLEVAAYRLEFPRAAVFRRDLNVAATAHVRVVLSELFGLDFEARYARNAGRAPPFTYDRFAVMTALTMATGF